MLRTIVRKEVLTHILSMRFAVTFVLFLLLIFTSMYVTINAHLQELDEHRARERTIVLQLDKIFEEQDMQKRTQRLLWQEGVTYAIPPAPLAWLGQGLQPGYPAAINTRRQGVRNTDRGLTRNPLLGLLRAPDFVYIVNSILSLLAILFMFDAICGEKQSGTLRLILSNAVPRHTLLLGKWIAGYAVLMVPFLIASIGGLGYAWVRGILQFDNEDIVRVVAILCTAAIYIAAFFNISLFVSTTTCRSSTSLLIGLLIWVASVIVIPNLAPVTASLLHPTPPRRSIEAGKKAIRNETYLKQQALLTAGQLSYGKGFEQAQQELWDDSEQRMRALDAYFANERDAQMRLAQTLGRISPAACWTYAAASLAGTGPAALEQFQSNREDIRKRFYDFAEQKVQAARKTRWKTWEPIERADLPPFRMSFPDTARSVSFALNDILILLILNVVFFMLGFVFFLRYDVR